MDFETRIAHLDNEGADYEIEVSFDPPGMHVHVDGAEPEFYPQEES